MRLNPRRKMEFQWTSFDGTVERFMLLDEGEFGWCHEFIAKAFAEASERGWTLPKWWQFWRWNDFPRKSPIIGGGQ